MEIFETIFPSSLLAPYIKHYWILETELIPTSPQRVIPHGSMELIFHTGSRTISQSSDGSTILQPRSFLGGHTIGFSDLYSTGKIQMISITFQPYGAKAFFDIPLYEFYEKIISVDDLNDHPLLELEDRLFYSPDHHSSIRLIEKFLLERLQPFKEYNYKRMLTAIQTINKNQSDINISTLAQATCLSNKQFNRIFTEHIGSNPKDYLRIVRFQRALYILQKNPGISFAHLAYECGFYDQSHLISEFKTFSGYTPTEYIAICPPYSDYFS